ncbi:hypothetical protein [Erythrobacter litoralis]|uniref:Uncharacterized protein n=1 Tax=Erythrobacter litoralis (strain HTCC2594) TaxID=314225 RepID=Q2N6M3_ERYLH|nr:hypothetical protein [Erythrobacter litoralis]ABC64668.1 hypothetical protein ELI_12880 [Erythrobacter litoralis HTCC2594]
MLIVIVFMLGIANFAMHSAVMRSGHPVLQDVPWLATKGGRRIAMALEFLILAAALSLARMGFPMSGWAYGFYSACNGIAAWMILSRRK